MESTSHDRLMLLAEAAETLPVSLAAEELVPRIMDLSARLFAADAYAIWRFDPSRQIWRAIADRNLSAGYDRVLRPSERSMPEEPFACEDVLLDPRTASRREAYQSEGIRAMLAAPLRIRGEVSGTIVFYHRRPRRFEEQETRLAAALAGMASTALTNAELYAEQLRLREAEERAARRLQFLAEASVVLSASLDYHTTLQHVARLVVPHLADWCTVHVVTPEGPPRVVAVAHVDPEKVAWSRSLEGRYAYNPEEPRGLPNVLRTGEPELYPHIPDELLEESARDAEHLEILRRVGFSSVIIAPMRVGERVLGAVTLVSAESGFRYGEADLLLAQDLAGRAAMAMENSRIYGESERAREQAEAAARSRQEAADRLGLALEFARLGDWSWDARTDQVEFSPRGRQIFGLSPDEPVTWAGILERLHPQDVARVRREVERVVRTGESYHVEYRIRLPDGSQRWVTALGRARYGSDGGVEGMLGVVQDISARKEEEAALRESEERLRLATAAAGAGHWLFDAGARGGTWSEECCRLYGFGPELREPTLELWLERVHPADRDYCLQAIQQAVTTLGELDIEYRYAHPELGQRTLVSIGRVLGGSRGGATRMAGISLDVTDRRRLESELREKVEQLALSDRRKDEFLAMLAHELRNPLASIVNAAEILRLRARGEPLLEDQRRVIERQARHLTRIVDDLLEVARVTEGKLELRREAVELAPICEQAVAATGAQISARRHTLEVRLPAEPLWVEADPTRLMQVVVNLLVNAARYTDPGGRIDLSAAREGDEAVVRVRDNGRGIRPELIDSVFEMFVQGEPSLARSEGGLGVGLTLAKTLVEMHGGRLAARSEGPGQGSEFTIRLPLLEHAGEAARAAGPPGEEGDGVRRVLLVEDNPDAAETMTELLELWGHRVRAVHDGTGALDAVEAFRPDVVLLDIGLPGLDGYEVARRLRATQNGERPFVVALTGYGDAGHRRRAAEAGFDFHMVKPVDTGALRSLLAAVPARPAG